MTPRPRSSVPAPINPFQTLYLDEMLAQTMASFFLLQSENRNNGHKNQEDSCKEMSDVLKRMGTLFTRAEEFSGDCGLGAENAELDLLELD